MPKIQSINIQGYRAFGDFNAHFSDLEIIVGANGSGKSSLFEFLKFLRNGMTLPIPRGLIPDATERQVLHVPGYDRIKWAFDIKTQNSQSLVYSGELINKPGNLVITAENAYDSQFQYLETKNQQGILREGSEQRSIGLLENNLALGTASDLTLVTLRNLREYIAGWRFYDAFSISNSKMRDPVFIDDTPLLSEDAGNLSAVLHYLLTEHRPIFDDVQQLLRSCVPGFPGLIVKAYGGRGKVTTFWQEQSIDNYPLTLADLSDGVLRLLCWIVLCLQPKLPPLICIDEPEQGVHPRTLPVLAALFEKASRRTQILLATHSSYFLTQFDFSRIAVMRKENGEAAFIKPENSQVLTSILADFGTEEIERLHKSDELELLP